MVEESEGTCLYMFIIYVVAGLVVQSSTKDIGSVMVVGIERKVCTLWQVVR